MHEMGRVYVYDDVMCKSFTCRRQGRELRSRASSSRYTHGGAEGGGGWAHFASDYE